MASSSSAALSVLFYACSACSALVLGACGDDGAAPRDATTPDIDNGTCGSMLRFTGEYVDWDSGTAFCGVFGARFQPPGGGAPSSTAPNGRFDLCLPDAPTTLVDITPPTAASACTKSPQTYTLPALAVANKAVIAAGGMWSGRAFGMARQAIDPAKAQVLVHVNGTPPALSITATHGPTQAMMTDTWAPGDTGHDVFFPDVDPAGGSTTLSASGAIGAGTIPLVAGKMTNLTIIAR